ncbi:MAG: ATP-binding protein, partial [Chloroflexota bacterium]
DRPTFEAAVAQAWAAPATNVSVTTRSVGPTGDVRWLCATMRNWEEDPAIGGLVINIRDVTDERLSTERLVASERRLRALVQNSSDAITLRTGDQVTLLNPAAVSMFAPQGLDHATAAPCTLLADDVGRSYEHTIHPEDHDRVASLVEELRGLPGETRVSQHRVRNGDGWLWVEAILSNHVDDPDINGITANVRDITAMKLEEERSKRFAEKQAAANHALRDASLIKSQFLAMITHDFRTPLTSIQGFSEMIETRMVEADEAQELAAVIHREAVRLNKMVTDMLQSERMVSNGYAPKFAACQLREVAERAVQSVVGGFPDRVVTITTENADHPVSTDPEALHQIITNLVSNALKCSPAGGSAELRLSVVNSTLCIEVEDHGIGIPEEMLDRVFEHYTRVDSTASRQIRGVGLGLAIVRHLAEELGGRAWAESTLGEGTTMHVRIAIQPALKEIPIVG